MVLPPLSTGLHAFQVAVTSAAGTADPSPATVAWEVDATAPALAFTDAPAATSDLRAPTFAFTASDPHGPVSTACALDGAAAAPCTSPHPLAGLGEAAHTLVVTATDALGNQAVASHAWTVAVDDCLVDNGGCGAPEIATCVDAVDTVDCLCELGYVVVAGACAPAWVQQAYAKASNPGGTDRFGWSAALSGDGSRLAVGGYQEDSAATTVDGNGADDTASNAGAVYVFARTGASWTQEAYLKAANAGAGDNFGVALDLDDAGARIVVGAWQEDSIATGVDGNGADNTSSNSGAAYVFTRAGTTWTQQAYLKASNSGAGDWFGYAVAISGDGAHVVVGARNEDSAASGIDGDGASNAAGNSGAAYVFDWDGLAWAQASYLKASATGAGDQLGYAVAISGDGSVVAAGAWQEDGAGVGVGADEASNAASNSGCVYLFTRTAGGWANTAYVKATNTDANDVFGTAVALSGDGARLVVGAYAEDGNGLSPSDNSTLDTGAAYVYVDDGSGWAPEAYLKPAVPGVYDYFGTAVSLTTDGAALAVSSSAESSAATTVNGDQTNDAGTYAGAGYVFVRTGSTWTQESYFKASNAGANDLFGTSATISADGSTVAFGAYGEDSAAAGVDGVQADDSLTDSGATYVYARR
ncbi:MAG: integrin [Kofleriaceae bacterium]